MTAKYDQLSSASNQGKAQTECALPVVAWFSKRDLLEMMPLVSHMKYWH